MRKITWIHGAASSPTTFNYLADNIESDSLFLSYCTDDGLDYITSSLRETIIDAGFEDSIVISHSLGGIISLLLHDQGLQFEKIITMSTPFGGSRIATLLKWWIPTHRLYSEVAHNSQFIRHIRNISCTSPVYSFVTATSGYPVFQEPNDGVVTVSSQKALSYPKYIDMDMNHFEVLLSEDVARHINQIIKK